LAVGNVDATFLVCFPDGSSAQYPKDELDADFTIDDPEAPTRPWVPAKSPQGFDQLGRIKAMFGADGKPLQPAQPLPPVFHKYRGHGIVEELSLSPTYIQWSDTLSLMLTLYSGTNDLKQFARYRYNVRFPRVAKSCECDALTMDHFSPTPPASDLVYEIRLCDHPSEAPFNGRHAKFVRAYPENDAKSAEQDDKKLAKDKVGKVSVIVLEQDNDTKHAKDKEGKDIVLELDPENLAEATARCVHNFVEMKLSDLLTDAWFDSKPDEMDDKYIKWRDRPSTCIPCAPTAVASLKPAAASEQPPQQEPTESFESPANHELQIMPVLEAKPTAALQIMPVLEAKPTAAPELQPPQQDPIESKSPANQELQIGMSEKFADHVGQSDFMHV